MSAMITTARIRVARALGGFLDFFVVLLCLWAAAYHTPAGALARRLTAWVLHLDTSARPLLSYFSGGPQLVITSTSPAHLPVLAPARTDLPPELAMALGTWTSLEQLPAASRASAYAEANSIGLTQALVDDRDHGPRVLGPIVARLTKELGSEDAAVLAVFCGEAPARFALERVRAETGEVDIDRLVAQLPPSFEDRSHAAIQALALGTAYGLSWPVPERWPLSSPFGLRQHPTLGVEKLHTGVDIPMPEGTEVRAAGQAIVRRASEDAVNGRVLVLDHGHGVTTAYLHNSKLLVVEGAHVTRGEVISRSGSTGRSTGPHLHFQLAVLDTPVDPLAFRPRPAQVAGSGAEER